MTKTMIRPTSDRVVVRRIQPDSETPGGIFLPSEIREMQPRGVVVATGPGKLLDDGSHATMEVQEGDTVVFSPYSTTEVRIEDDILVVMRESEVLFIE